MTNRGWIVLLGGGLLAGGVYLAYQRKREGEGEDEIETDELGGEGEPPPVIAPPIPPELVNVPPAAPGGFPPEVLALYDKCRAGGCTPAEIAELLSYVYSLASDPALTAAERRWVNDVLGEIQGFPRVQGVHGRHVGGCACKQRQEVQGTGACCSSCAHGGPCEECGHDEPD